MPNSHPPDSDSGSVHYDESFLKVHNDAKTRFSWIWPFDIWTILIIHTGPVTTGSTGSATYIYRQHRAVQSVTPTHTNLLLSSYPTMCFTSNFPRLRNVTVLSVAFYKNTSWPFAAHLIYLCEYCFTVCCDTDVL